MEYVRREVEERYLVEEAIDPNGIEGFGHVEESCVSEHLFAEISGYSFKEAGQLKDVLCLGLNPNCLSRSRPRSFATCKILASRVFSNTFPIVPKRLMGQ